MSSIKTDLKFEVTVSFVEDEIYVKENPVTNEEYVEDFVDMIEAGVDDPDAVVNVKITGRKETKV